MPIEIGIALDGMAELYRTLDPRQIRRAEQQGMEAALLQTEVEAVDAATSIIYAKPESPRYRRTGAYRASLGRGGSGNVRELQDGMAKFGTKLFYARFLEEGTKHMAARHVLESAVTRGRGRIEQAYARAFYRALD